MHQRTNKHVSMFFKLLHVFILGKQTISNAFNEIKNVKKKGIKGNKLITYLE